MPAFRPTATAIGCVLIMSRMHNHDGPQPSHAETVSDDNALIFLLFIAREQMIECADRFARFSDESRDCRAWAFRADTLRVAAIQRENDRTRAIAVREERARARKIERSTVST